MNIDIAKKYTTRDKREVVVFEVSDKVYCMVKCLDGWHSVSRSLSGTVVECGKYNSGDLVPVKGWRAWNEREAPKCFVVRQKGSDGDYVAYAGRPQAYYCNLFANYFRVHEDGTTTPCGVEE